MTPVANALDPPLLPEDAQYGADGVRARGPDQFIRRGVYAAGDIAGKVGKDRVVEVIEAGDGRQDEWVGA